MRLDGHALRVVSSSPSMTPATALATESYQTVAYGVADANDNERGFDR